MRTSTTHDDLNGPRPETCTVMVFKTRQEDTLMRRVRGEFHEMPGMRLTLDQAVRLWALDRAVCSDLFATLVASHYLEIDACGRYRLAHGGH